MFLARSSHTRSVRLAEYVLGKNIVISSSDVIAVGDFVRDSNHVQFWACMTASLEKAKDFALSMNAEVLPDGAEINVPPAKGNCQWWVPGRGAMPSPTTTFSTC